jgi:hypothetical protein
VSDGTASPRPGKRALEHLARARGEDASACWPWDGWIDRRQNQGYGLYHSPFERTNGLAHRLAWQVWVGPIPLDLVVDHVCHTNDLTCIPGVECLHRRCVNPAHMELVTRAENTRRSHLHLREFVKCKNGHPRADHGRLTPSGRWECELCRKELQTRYDRSRGHKPRHPWDETCPHGHPLEGNLRIGPSGVKCCRACEREKSRTRRGLPPTAA